MHNIYDDWVFLFLRDWLPTMTFIAFVLAIVVIKISGEFDE